MRRLRIALMLLAGILAALPAAARGVPGFQQAPGGIEVTGPLVLQPLTAVELVGGTAVPSGGGAGELAVGLPSLDFVPPISTTVTRVVANAWQALLPPGIGRKDLQVELEVVDFDGNAGCLSVAGGTPCSVRVRTFSEPPVEVGGDGTHVLVQGGATFVLDIAAVRQAGEYGGTLRVSLVWR